MLFEIPFFFQTGVEFWVICIYIYMLSLYHILIIWCLPGLSWDICTPAVVPYSSTTMSPRITRKDKYSQAGKSVIKVVSFFGMHGGKSPVYFVISVQFAICVKILHFQQKWVFKEKGVPWKFLFQTSTNTNQQRLSFLCGNIKREVIKIVVFKLKMVGVFLKEGHSV